MDAGQVHGARRLTPFGVGPPSATVSPSKNTGSDSTSTPALLTVMQDRSH